MAQRLPSGVRTEIIVVDDGSTMPIAELLKPYQPRIKLITLDKNYGVSVARNRGAAVANGEYLAFLDSDDLWLPNKLAAHIATHKSGLMVSYTDSFWYRGGKFVNIPDRYRPPDPSCTDFLAQLLQRCTIGMSTIMVETALFHDCGGFNEELRVCEDFDFLLRLAAQSLEQSLEWSLEWGYIPKKLAIKRHSELDGIGHKIANRESIYADIIGQILLEKGATIPYIMHLTAEKELAKKREIKGKS